MKKKRNSGGGANWMDTYGDMVTLLLCFFVLMYSISSINQKKYVALAQSFNPDSVEATTGTSKGGGSQAGSANGAGSQLDELAASAQAKLNSSKQEEVNNAMDQLYAELKASIERSGAKESIELTKGDGYVFLSFNDAVFFNGDSYVLRPDGEAILHTVAKALSSVSNYIDEVRIMGHTAQASPDHPNIVDVDRFLSSNRATIAAIYIQKNSTIDPGRIVSVGYGQHRPVDTNDTEAGRSHNRRVEIIVTGFDMENQLGDSIEQYYSMRKDAGDSSAAAPNGSSAN